MTIRELLTSTANVTLPTMVDARALLQLQTMFDYRPICKRANVPKGSGKTAYFQILTSSAPDDNTEGTGFTPADPTVANAYVTVAEFGKATIISDLLANTSAIDFVEEVGRLHGATCGKAMVSKIGTALVSATGNAVTVGVKGDLTEASFDFSNVATATGNIIADGFIPTHILTGPDKMWKAFTTSYAVTQFTGALNDFMLSGRIPNVMGLEWVADPYFEVGTNGGSLWNGTDGEEYAVITTAGQGAGWGEMGTVPQSELYREPLKLQNTIVTSMVGAAVKLVDNASAVIEHAA